MLATSAILSSCSSPVRGFIQGDGLDGLGLSIHYEMIDGSHTPTRTDGKVMVSLWNSGGTQQFGFAASSFSREHLKDVWRGRGWKVFVNIEKRTVLIHEKPWDIDAPIEQLIVFRGDSKRQTWVSASYDLPWIPVSGYGYHVTPIAVDDVSIWAQTSSGRCRRYYFDQMRQIDR